jgi:hypothetical protein
MLFNQLDPIRLFYIYVLEGSVLVMFLVLGAKILKRDKQRLNLMFACFYLFAALGIMMNFIYVPLSVVPGYEQTVLILNILTIFLVAFSMAFLVGSQLIILKSTMVFNTAKQCLLLLGYALLNGTLFFFLRYNGVVFNEESEWIAAFSLPFYLYLLALLTFAGVIPTFYLAFTIRGKMEDELLKKRWNHFIGGILLIILFMYTTYTFNYINGTAARGTIMAISGLFGVTLLVVVVAGAYQVYYGVGKQLGSSNAPTAKD